MRNVFMGIFLVMCAIFSYQSFGKDILFSSISENANQGEVYKVTRSLGQSRTYDFSYDQELLSLTVFGDHYVRRNPLDVNRNRYAICDSNLWYVKNSHLTAYNHFLLSRWTV